MWWQGQPQFHGTSSPIKDIADRESHAHSPRRREASMKLASIQREGSMGPPPMLSDPKALEAFRPLGIQRDPFWSQKSQVHDPFISETGYHNEFFNKATGRHASGSGSGDISMPNTSRYGSSSHDDPMHDYQRSLSPISSHCSYPMPDASRPHSLASSRNISNRPNPVINELRLGDALEGHEDDSHFNNMYATVSPRNGSGISAPSNTRASSAANTPPEPQRDGSAAVLRAASYNTHARSVPVTNNDPPPPYIRIPSNLAKQQPDSRGSSSSVRVGGNSTDTIDLTVAKKPRGRPKGRKEGRNSELGLEAPSQNIHRRISAGSTGMSDKENDQTNIETGSNGKRKRSTSDVFPEDIMRKSSSYLEFSVSEIPSPTRKTSKSTLRHDISPAKLETEDVLTPDGIVTRIRTPLGELENIN